MHLLHTKLSAIWVWDPRPAAPITIDDYLITKQKILTRKFTYRNLSAMLCGMTIDNKIRRSLIGDPLAFRHD